MIKSIKFIQYRKLKNISFQFNKGVNIISGSNGTCKSSILYIVSNSFKKVTKNNTRLNNKDALNTVNQINKLINPKIETLTKGDKEYNDPAPNVKGTLYECTYLDNLIINFRKHNSKQINRYSIKPKYTSTAKESLPALPIIYLGLFRLFPFGEFSDNETLVSSLSKKISNNFKKDLASLYSDFTGYELSFENINSMGNIKNRIGFKTNKQGIDSNTISAGEDNLLIILASLYH